MTNMFQSCDIKTMSDNKCPFLSGKLDKSELKCPVMHKDHGKSLKNFTPDFLKSMNETIGKKGAVVVWTCSECNKTKQASLGKGYQKCFGCSLVFCYTCMPKETVDDHKRCQDCLDLIRVLKY